MKILIVHNHYRSNMPSGELRVVQRESAGLRELGHSVQMFERHSDDIESWPMARRATLPARMIWNRGSSAALIEELSERRPDIVHVHNIFPLLSPSVLSACNRVGVPVVVTVHNYRAACPSGSFYRDGRICTECTDHSRLRAVAHGCYRESRAATLPLVLSVSAMRRAWQRDVSAFMFISARQRELLSNLALSPERVFIKHNSVPEPAEVEIAAEHAVAFLGRLDEPKGGRLLMRGWDEFRARSPRSSLRLDIAGAGPLTSEMESWASGRSDVQMLGVLDSQACTRLLRRSAALVAPSAWEEAFGMVAVEAMATGTAPIAPAHGAFPEIITDGSDGRLVGPNDPAALAEAFQDVDGNPARWTQMGARGRNTYEERFTTERGMARLLEVYRFAIDHRIGAGRTKGVGDGVSQPPAAVP